MAKGTPHLHLSEKLLNYWQGVHSNNLLYKKMSCTIFLLTIITVIFNSIHPDITHARPCNKLKD